VTNVPVPVTDLTILWSLGSMCVFVWYASGHVVMAHRLRRARRVAGALQREAETVAGDAIRVLIAAEADGPFVCGVVKPAIVLPAEAETWGAARRQAVLLHELAHIRRRDCRVQLLSQIACVVYWFNPLVWVAARALRIERERACDDEVLVRGTTPSGYAAELLGLARARRRQWHSSAVLAMARPTELETRVRAILALHCPRVQARTTRLAAAVAMFAGTVVVLGAHAADRTPVPASTAVARERPAASAREQDREQATLELALDSRPDVVPALIAALHDPDAQVREKAALGLGWRSDDRVIAPLVTALGDADAQVREKAAIALGSSGNARAAAPLEDALANDPDGEVREKAAVGLTFLRAGGDPEENGKQVREALNLIVGGVRRLTQ
jgi:hypothetical protein